MKKYTGFIAVAGIILSLSLAAVARAEDTGLSVSGSASVQTDANDDNGASGSVRADLKEMRQDRQDNRQNRLAFRQQLLANRQAFVSKLQADRQAFLADVNAKKGDWKNIKAEDKQKFYDTAKTAIAARFDAVVTMMADFQVKVGDMIDSLHADGKDTTDATADLNASIGKLNDAKAVLATLKGEVPADSADISADLWAKIKTDARTAKDDLKESRQDLHDAIQEIKDLNGGADVELHADASAN